MSINAASLVVTIGADTAMAQQGIMGLVQMLGKAGPLAIGAGGAALAVAGIAVSATKMAADFQTGLTQLVTGAGESQKNLALVSSGILQMARDTGTSTSQLTSGMYMIESAGYHGAQGLAILQAAAEGAKVGGADLGTVADATTTILKDYGSSGITAAQAVNFLVATVANGKTHMEDLAGALSGILPTASAAGVSLRDVMGAMATMTGEGVDAANATTYLRQLLLNLTAPASAAKKALADVGLSTDQVAAAMKKSLPDALKMIQQHLAATYGQGTPQYIAAMKDITGGTREIQGMLDLTGQHLATFQANVTSVAGAVTKGGNAIAGWSLVQGTFNQKMSQLGEVIETLMIGLGQQLLPAATHLVTLFSGALSGAVSLLTRHFDLVKPVLLGVGAAIAVALVPAVAALAGTLAALVGTALVAAAPFLAIGAAIAGFALLIKHAYDTSEPFREAVERIETAFHGLASTFMVQVGPALTKLQPVLKEIAAWLGDHLQQAAKVLTPLLTQAANTVAQFATDLAVRLGPALQNVFTFIQTALPILQALWNAVWPALSFVLKSVWTEIAGIIEIAWSLVSGIIKIGLDILGGNWRQAWADLQSMLAGVWDGIKKVLQGAIGNVLGLIGQLAGGILNGLASLPGKLLSLGVQLMANLGKGIAQGASHVTDALKNVPLIGGAASDLSHLLPHFADGGTMPETGLALVGERGPELVRLPGGAQVSPSGSMGGTIPGAGSGLTPVGGGAGNQATTQQIIIQLDAKVLTQAVVKQMPQVVRLGTGTRHM